MEITYYIKSVYGREAIYIASEHKTAIQGLTGRKTLLPSDIKNLKRLGFTFRRINQPSQSLLLF